MSVRMPMLLLLETTDAFHSSVNASSTEVAAWRGVWHPEIISEGSNARNGKTLLIAFIIIALPIFIAYWR
ncbi:MAG: hypothetical protein COB00_04150 [Alcanivorax sp.]|nr:MAG: hypothetical protein COB00_04150 [Alcanivorax sp.]